MQIIGNIIGYIQFIIWRRWFTLHTKEWQRKYVKDYRKNERK